ncbi:MAG: hypothetical protein HYV42_02755 [Candidatus Magasanikbacteria bacterium]|nr:hypothetical protein [Candidatus Magasanikbacteria bacterium]
MARKRKVFPVFRQDTRQLEAVKPRGKQARRAFRARYKRVRRDLKSALNSLPSPPAAVGSRSAPPLPSAPQPPVAAPPPPPVASRAPRSPALPASAIRPLELPGETGVVWWGREVPWWLAAYAITAAAAVCSLVLVVVSYAHPWAGYFGLGPVSGLAATWAAVYSLVWIGKRRVRARKTVARSKPRSRRI